MKPLLFVLLASIFSTQSWATDAPQHNCKKPIIPATQASDSIVHLFDKRVKAYKSCLSDFIDQQQAISKSATDQAAATLAHDTAESAIKEYNDFIEEIKQRDIAAGKAPDDEEK